MYIFKNRCSLLKRTIQKIKYAGNLLNQMNNWSQTDQPYKYAYKHLTIPLLSVQCVKFHHDLKQWCKQLNLLYKPAKHIRSHVATLFANCGFIFNKSVEICLANVRPFRDFMNPFMYLHCDSVYSRFEIMLCGRFQPH